MMTILVYTLIGIACVFVLGVVSIITVCYLVSADEHLLLEHLERKHGLRDNE